MELELGLDNKYCICYKSSETPNRHSLFQLFKKYGLFVRVDEVKQWVFLRSSVLEDVQRCIDELGATYDFRPCNNSRKRSEYETQADMPPQPSDNASHPISESAEEEGLLYLTVIIRLPANFTEKEIGDLLKKFGMYPHEIEKGFTPNLSPYCNVYFKTEEEAALLCSKLHGHYYKGRHLCVKDVNDLL